MQREEIASTSPVDEAGEGRRYGNWETVDGAFYAARGARRYAMSWIVIALLVVVTTAVYSPVLFNFFAGDDFVHLTWLRDAVIQPELIWRNFHSSWLDGTTTKFYRPLISVFMVTDYLVWHTNGLGFHLTNLAFHIAGSIFLFLIMQELLLPLPSRSSKLWAAGTAALFALYPLHPEAVSWITGRVDAIVTAFILASVWLYMRLRNHGPRMSSGGKALTLAGAIISFVLALLSKEMAITVPAVLAAWELARGTKFLTIIRSTLPFWLLLACYFVVRRFALGTFVGGYDDSLFFIADLKGFIYGWLHALRMTLVPINKEVFGAHSLYTKVWEVLLVSGIVLGIVNFVRHREYRPAVLFLCLWLIFCLVPVYKIFAITDDLQGSRLAYLSTVPITALLFFGFATMRQSIVASTTSVILLGLSAFLLHNNNLPWREAGLQSNAIRRAFEQIYTRIDADPQTLVIGLPDNLHGAYVCRNAVCGMLKRPQLSKDVFNCLMINGFDPIEPFGYWKASLQANAARARIFAWQPVDQKFLRVNLSAAPAVTPHLVLSPVAPSVELKAERPAFLIDVRDVPCWEVDFVRVDLNVAQTGNSKIGADLLFTNSLSPQFALINRAHASLPSQPGRTSVIFAFRGLCVWALADAPAQLKLLLPPGSQARVEGISVVSGADLMPSLSFPKGDFFGSKGYMHLDRSRGDMPKVSVDATNLQHAATTELEVSRANQWFEDQNCAGYSKVRGQIIPGPLQGAVVMQPSFFRAPGIYQVRARAKDAQGNIVGVASDHINIAVN